MNIRDLLAHEDKKLEGPLPPQHPMIRFMTEDQGPFRCDHCIFFVKLGQPCPWQTNRIMQAGDCCGMYWPENDLNVPKEYIPYPGWKPTR